MKNLKVVTVVGTRPEIIRLSMLIPKLDAVTEHTLIHTGQNYDEKLNQVFFDDLKLRMPDFFLDVDATSIGTVMGQTLIKVEQLLKEIRPDAVMILGDTNSSVAAVIAERMQIPVYHMEAGNRSFDANVPEELNRKMVDHVSSFNLPYNDYSLRNLLNEGISPRFISKTGSPIREIYHHYSDEIEKSSVLNELGLTEGQYFLASIHRQENVDSPVRLHRILDCLSALRDHFSLPILVSTHPRTRKRLDNLSGFDLEGIDFHEPFGFLDYMKLQKNSHCVVSDSGTISEEASIVGFPAVTLRDSMERPEAVETGSIILTGLDRENLIDAVKLITSRKQTAALPQGYEITDFSHRVVSFLFSTARVHKTWKNIH